MVCITNYWERINEDDKPRILKVTTINVLLNMISNGTPDDIIAERLELSAETVAVFREMKTALDEDDKTKNVHK